MHKWVCAWHQGTQIDGQSFCSLGSLTGGYTITSIVTALSPWIGSLSDVACLASRVDPLSSRVLRWRAGLYTFYGGELRSIQEGPGAILDCTHGNCTQPGLQCSGVQRDMIAWQ